MTLFVLVFVPVDTNIMLHAHTRVHHCLKLGQQFATKCKDLLATHRTLPELKAGAHALRTAAH